MKDRESFYVLLQELLRIDKKYFLFTQLSGEGKGKKTVYCEDGGLHWGDALNYEILPPVSCPGIWKQNEKEYFVEEIENDPEVLLLGAGHVSRAIAEILLFIGCRVTVADDRAEYLKPEFFPNDTKRILMDFACMADYVDLNKYQGIIIVTRAHEFDAICLRQLKPYLKRYIGVMGSRKRVFHVLDALRKEGWNDSELDFIRAPIGLDIGCETPEEIALSIVSEYLAVIRGQRAGGPLKDKRN